MTNKWYRYNDYYICDELSVKIHKGFPSFNSSKCWILYDGNKKEYRYYGTLKEAKQSCEV